VSMSEIFELSRMKRRRRPRPLRELDGRARRARLALEAQLFRPPLVPLLLRFTEAQLQRVDAERRIEDSRGVPSRCATIRALVGRDAVPCTLMAHVAARRRAGADPVPRRAIERIGGDDNWAAAGRPARWMGVETTTVEPGPGRMMVDHGQHQPSSMRSFRIVAHVAGWLRVSLRICP
jgi:hypothetical protein